MRLMCRVLSDKYSLFRNPSLNKVEGCISGEFWKGWEENDGTDPAAAGVRRSDAMLWHDGRAGLAAVCINPASPGKILCPGFSAGSGADGSHRILYYRIFIL